MIQVILQGVNTNISTSSTNVMVNGYHQLSTTHQRSIHHHLMILFALDSSSLDDLSHHHQSNHESESASAVGLFSFVSSRPPGCHPFSFADRRERRLFIDKLRGYFTWQSHISILNSHFSHPHPSAFSLLPSAFCLLPSPLHPPLLFLLSLLLDLC